MGCFMLFYNLAEGFAEKRLPYRPEHQAHVDASRARGEFTAAGAYGDTGTVAALLFRGASIDAVRTFAENDPYVRSGIVRGWSVEPWDVNLDGVTR
jgi:uncharacterized protein YciI